MSLWWEHCTTDGGVGDEDLSSTTSLCHSLTPDPILMSPSPRRFVSVPRARGRQGSDKHWDGAGRQHHNNTAVTVLWGGGAVPGGSGVGWGLL